DGTYKWVKFPHRDNSPTGMHYQRLLALPEHTFTQARVPYSESELKRLPVPRPERGSWQEIVQRRHRGSTEKYANPDLDEPCEIPVVLDVFNNVQYREPTDYHKPMITSIAK